MVHLHEKNLNPPHCLTASNKKPSTPLKDNGLQQDSGITQMIGSRIPFLSRKPKFPYTGLVIKTCAGPVIRTCTGTKPVLLCINNNTISPKSIITLYTHVSLRSSLAAWHEVSTLLGSISASLGCKGYRSVFASAPLVSSIKKQLQVFDLLIPQRLIQKSTC